MATKKKANPRQQELSWSSSTETKTQRKRQPTKAGARKPTQKRTTARTAPQAHPQDQALRKIFEEKKAKAAAAAKAAATRKANVAKRAADAKAAEAAKRKAAAAKRAAATRKANAAKKAAAQKAATAKKAAARKASAAKKATSTRKTTASAASATTRAVTASDPNTRTYKTTRTTTVERSGPATPNNPQTQTYQTTRITQVQRNGRPAWLVRNAQEGTIMDETLILNPGETVALADDQPTESRLERKAKVAIGGVLGGVASLGISALIVRTKLAKPMTAHLLTSAAMGTGYVLVDNEMFEQAALSGAMIAASQALLVNAAQTRLREIAQDYAKANSLPEEQQKQIEAVVSQFLRNQDDYDFNGDEFPEDEYADAEAA